MWPAITVGAAAVFLMAGYELVRSPSTMLFQAAYGTSGLAAIQALSPACTLAMVCGYGVLLGRLGARRTLLATSLLSAAAMAALGTAIQSGWPPATALLYAFREGYIVLLVEQYWAFINSVQDEADSRRWNGWVGGLGSVGSFLGGWCIALLSERLGTRNMPFLAAAALIPAAALSDLAHARFGRRQRLEPAAREGADAGLLGLSVTRENPVLLLILLLVFLSQSVAVSLGLVFQDRLYVEIANLDRRTAYSGMFYSGVASFATIMQFVGTPVVLRWASTKAVLVAIPVLHLAGAALLSVWTTLPAATWALLLFKGLDYSIYRVTKETLYIPLSFDARYRAKETIDAFAYRFSGGFTSLIAYVLQRATGAAGGLYALIAAAASALWLGAVLSRTRRINFERPAQR